MYYAYIITNTINNNLYVGITKNIDNRWRAHKSRARRISSNSYLYNAMKKYGIENFTIEEVGLFGNLKDCQDFETSTISFFRDTEIPNYNMHNGGTAGYSMKDDDRYEEWKINLSLGRQGRTPALGMKHTKENKELFSKVSDAYWATQEVYDIDRVSKLSFKEANALYGISKTHYYRLKRGLLSE